MLRHVATWPVIQKHIPWYARPTRRARPGEPPFASPVAHPRFQGVQRLQTTPPDLAVVGCCNKLQPRDVRDDAPQLASAKAQSVAPADGSYRHVHRTG